MMRLITPPISEPISLETAKAHIRIDHNDDDNYILDLITAARQAVENHIRVSLMPQTRLLTMNEFKQLNYIAYGPVSSITSIKYIDHWGDEQTLDTALYQLHQSDDYDFFSVKPTKSFPEVGKFENCIAVQYQCGYTSAAAVPQTIKAAMLLHIGDMYENRELNILTLRFVTTNAYESLLSPHIRMLF